MRPLFCVECQTPANFAICSNTYIIRHDFISYKLFADRTRCPLSYRTVRTDTKTDKTENNQKNNEKHIDTYGRCVKVKLRKKFQNRIGGTDMKLFRIVYWFSSITTERYVRAENEAEARKKFAEFTDKKIVSIEEVQQ